MKNPITWWCDADKATIQGFIFQKAYTIEEAEMWGEDEQLNN